jgi:hypothetical protein
MGTMASGTLALLAKAERWALYTFLPNEANFSRCWQFCISFAESDLASKLCHFVSWLRLSGIGFVWGIRML